MEEIKRLIEERQIMATKKQLSTKLTSIVTSLGDGMYGDMGFGTGFGGSSLDTEAWMLPEERDEEIPTADDDDYSHLGYLFDALSMGHNFQVRYTTHDRELRAKYNGITVFLEEEGKLKAYLPDSVWEGLVDRLYVKSKPVEEANKDKAREENQKSFMKQAAKFMKELRESWGI